MLILYGITNEAISICKYLRHNWLLNGVLFYNADYIAKIYMEESPSRESFVEKIKPGGDFEIDLNKARALGTLMIDAFSPAQLIEGGPLAELQEDARNLVKKALHDDYLEKTEVLELSESLQAAVDDLFDVYNRFITEWYSQPPVEQARIKEAYESVRDKAKAVNEVLCRLPKGIMLT